MKRNTLLLVFSILLITGCGVYTTISSDRDNSADFSKYETFAWLPDKDSSNTPYNNQIIRNNTINYFSHCMGARGMKANVDSPDVLLQLEVKSVKKETTVTTATHYGAASYYSLNPYYYPYPTYYYYRSPYYNNYYNYRYGTIAQKVEYNESTITLNVIDRKENKLVWMGTAQGDLYDPSYIKDNLHPAVYDILNDYPVAPIGIHKRPYR